jgi:hypothetical protein
VTTTAVVLVVCALTVAFFALVVLGTLRELMVARTEINAVLRVLGEEQAPAVLQQRLPASVRERLPIQALGTPGRRVILAVAEGCGSCNAFLRTLANGRSASLAGSVTCVVEAKGADSELVGLAERISGNVIVDRAGAVLSDLDIRTTPAMLVVDTASETVIGHHTGPDGAWLENALRSGENGYGIHTVAGASA